MISQELLASQLLSFWGFEGGRAPFASHTIPPDRRGSCGSLKPKTTKNVQIKSFGEDSIKREIVLVIIPFKGEMERKLHGDCLAGPVSDDFLHDSNRDSDRPPDVDDLDTSIKDSPPHL